MLNGEVTEVQEGPVQIITTLTSEASHLFELDDGALEKILLRPDICDKKVAVVSVAGAFRKGKSFLLNFFLRYLQNKSKADWLGSDDERLAGFSWRGGSERETSGILMWPEPFIIRQANGDEIAVLLMDTQGAFDSQSTVKDCATVFALSTMVSSLQIYNLSQNIQEDDLQHLQLFTEYGRLALEDSSEKPFQCLLFCVRDWSFPYEMEYGFQGGSRLLERRLQVSDKQHPELQQLRKHIRSCFAETKCFLMPHPGLRVATSPEFTGKLAEIEPEFKQQLKALIPKLLEPESLVVKEINGAKVTCRELLEYFRVYIKIFQGEDLPEPKSMLIATAEANNLAAVAISKAHYCRAMEEVCGGDTAYLAPTDLDYKHFEVLDESLRIFTETRKMGGEEYSHSFKNQLEDEIREAYDNFIKVNNGKNLFRVWRTPSVLFILMLIFYFLQQIFQLVYIDVLATTCGSLLGVVLVTLGIWAYVRYSGSFRDVGQSIDDFASWLWENIFSPLSGYAVKEGVKKAIDIQRTLSAANNTTMAAQPKVPRKPSQRHQPPGAAATTVGTKKKN